MNLLLSPPGAVSVQTAVWRRNNFWSIVLVSSKHVRTTVLKPKSALTASMRGVSVIGAIEAAAQGCTDRERARRFRRNTTKNGVRISLKDALHIIINLSFRAKLNHPVKT